MPGREFNLRRKKKKPGSKRETGRIEEPKFSSPFKDLGKLVAKRTDHKSVATEAVARKTKPVPESKEMGGASDGSGEDAVLREAYRGVRPLAGGQRVPVNPKAERAVVSEESEVLAQLYDLVSGQGAFDLTETDEYVEGMRKGIDPRLISRLRRGEFAVQDHIDLHGMTQSAAREALTGFVVASVRNGLRTLLVVHGRGLRSPGGHPVLKHAASQWLSQGAIGSHVLAFATARPSDGGAGAMYVLLRRDRRRAAFDVLKGTKRHD